MPYTFFFHHVIHLLCLTKYQCVPAIVRLKYQVQKQFLMLWWCFIFLTMKKIPSRVGAEYMGPVYENPAKDFSWWNMEYWVHPSLNSLDIFIQQIARNLSHEGIILSNAYCLWLLWKVLFSWSFQVSFMYIETIIPIQHIAIIPMSFLRNKTNIYDKKHIKSGHEKELFWDVQ